MDGSSYERELKRILTKEGWLVFRSAGSFFCDLIALKPNEHMLIECKASKEKAYYTASSKESKAQFDALNNLAKDGYNVFYYTRWKRINKWDKFQLPLEPYPIFRRSE